MACEGEGLSPRNPLPSAGNKKAGITHLRETLEGRSTNRPKAWGQRGVRCEPRMPPSPEEGTGTPLHHNRVGLLGWERGSGIQIRSAIHCFSHPTSHSGLAYTKDMQRTCLHGQGQQFWAHGLPGNSQGG